MARRVAEFVQRRAVPVDRLEIGLRRRHLDVVLRRHIEGAFAADAEIDARRLDQRLDQAGLRCGRRDGKVVWQILALRDIEHGEALQERNGLRFLAGLLRALVLVVWNEAVGVDDGGAALALADMAAERQRLAEREPALDGETVLDDGAPKDQHIDSRILTAGSRVCRHRQRRLRRRRAPRLHPGDAARFELGDDLVGDVVVEARPVGAGASVAVMSGHRGSPRRAPGQQPRSVPVAQGQRPAVGVAFG